ncbi:MAG: nucleotide exchange factor GrpE [Chloroherpetonaceae bacterium]|nr:nucleotide exchange factor GrpE [Chloroherpetonaceae bacterium]MCS7212375.1 nucleotide exchange factor GrpE [Chloroherpetonaceae bacterium]MDW8018578.1 nucleotide exchange factor GrpE [Chloroherpetonaceae bacterium]
MFKRLFLLSMLLFAPLLLWAQTEQPTVCFYFKRQNPLDLDEGYTLFILNHRQRSDELRLRLPSKTKSLILELASDRSIPSLPLSNAEIVQVLENRLASFFTEFDKRKLASPAQYRDLIDALLSGERIVQQVSVSAFGIKDRVIVFNADAAEANPVLLKDPSTAEALALYNFAVGEWAFRPSLIDYKDRILKSALVLRLIRRSVLEQIFDVRQPQAQHTELPIEQLKQIQKADERATWAVILAFLSAVVSLYAAVVSTGFLRRKRDQISKLDAKVRHLESKLNKPFYQEVLQQSDPSAASAQTIEILAARLAALERHFNLAPSAIEIKSELGQRLQALILSFISRWQTAPPIQENELLQKLLFYLNELRSDLVLLDTGLQSKSFIQKCVIPHIDKIDALFQAEPDAPLNTPHGVQEYLKALMEALNVTEIEVRPKQSLFDVEKHEKVGAVLKTNYEPGTVIKVLRRGLVYDGSIRKAQVIKAE